MELTYELVKRVRPEVDRQARRTPLESAPELSEISGRDVYLKCENLQRTGSFKVRGAVAKLSSLSDEEKARGVLAVSAGNHGKAVAWIARQMGIDATIHVPAVCPQNKVQAMRRYGAQVVVSSHAGYDATEVDGLRAATEEGKVWISPYDDPLIMAGAGTVGCEVLEELPGVDAIVVPVGGGGLGIGIGIASRALSPQTRLIGVNTSASPGMALSRRDGRAYATIDSEPTLAEGLEGGVSERAFDLANRFIDDIVVAQESSLPHAIARTLKHHRFAIEGSAAVAVTAVLDGLLDARYRKVVLILSGGNIDYSLFRRIVRDHPLVNEP